MLGALLIVSLVVKLDSAQLKRESLCWHYIWAPIPDLLLVDWRMVEDGGEYINAA